MPCPQRPRQAALKGKSSGCALTTQPHCRASAAPTEELPEPRVPLAGKRTRRTIGVLFIAGHFVEAPSLISGDSDCDREGEGSAKHVFVCTTLRFGDDKWNGRNQIKMRPLPYKLLASQATLSSELYEKKMSLHFISHARQ